MLVVVAVVGAVLIGGAAIAVGAVAAHRASRSAGNPGALSPGAATTVPPASDAPTIGPGTAPGTTAPGTSSSSLGASVPRAFSDNCTSSDPTDYLDTAAQAQVVCTGLAVPDADTVIYVQYPQSQQAEDYFSQTLLQGNGLTTGAGQCSGLQLAGNATNGTFCENPVTTSGGAQTGSQFVFQGTSFTLGSGNNVTDLCSSGNETTSTTPGFTVVGWTDDPDNVTTLAVSCSTDQATEQAVESDFLGGQYDLRTPSK